MKLSLGRQGAFSSLEPCSPSYGSNGRSANVPAGIRSYALHRQTGKADPAMLVFPGGVLYIMSQTQAVDFLYGRDH